MVTNSVVPIAKPPMASATTASPKWAVRTGASVRRAVEVDTVLST